MPDVTHILSAIEQGDPSAAEQLLPLVYDELRRLAAQKLAREPAGHTLQATALVHDAYLRLVGEEDPGWNGRGHFFAAAAEAMRRILIENARRRARLKHGGQFVRVDAEALEVEALAVRVASALEPLAVAGPVNQDPPHGLGRGGEEMTPTVPGLSRIVVEQAQVGLMNQSGGL